MEENVRLDKDRIQYWYGGFFAAKGCLGVALLIMGFISWGTERGKHTWGPPYFIGAFVTGTLSAITSILALLAARTSANMNMGSQHDVKRLAGFIRYETGLTYMTLLSAIGGIVILHVSGMHGCEDMCNFSRNINHHSSLALVILLALISAIVIGILTTYLNCCSPLLVDLRKYMRGNIYIYNPERPEPVQYNADTAGTRTIQPSAPVTSSQNPDEVMRLQEENRRLREQLDQSHLGGFTAPPPSYAEVIHQLNKKTKFTGESPPINRNPYVEERTRAYVAMPSAPPLDDMT